MGGHLPTLGSIVEQAVEECEAAHTSNKKFYLSDIPRILGPANSIGWF
jgi:hypothetical protein